MMKFCLTAALVTLSFLSYRPLLFGETVTLRSGKEVEIIDGQLPEKVAAELYREAEDLLKKGRLDLAGDYWQLIVERAKGGAITRARAAQEKIGKVEYGSFVVLGNGKILRGKVRAFLRADLLGLEGKEEIALWRLEEIVAEYHPGYSQVSKTFYPLTLLEIKFRDGELKAARITGEVEFMVEGADGAVVRALLGKEYEVLRDGDLGGQLQAMTTERITKVLIYPDLKRAE